jgi:nitrate reductase alpha subunit
MSDQWRYETYGAEEFASPAGNGALDDRHLADCVACRAARLAADEPHLRP